MKTRGLDHFKLKLNFKDFKDNASIVQNFYIVIKKKLFYMIIKLYITV